jgi:hypothetical protein
MLEVSIMHKVKPSALCHEEHYSAIRGGIAGPCVGSAVPIAVQNAITSCIGQLRFQY